MASAFITNLFSVQGKVILVTGGNRGLGKHFSTTLAKAGAKVAIGSRSVQKAAGAVAEIRAAAGHNDVIAVQLSVDEPSTISPCFDVIEAQFGPVECLVNNAGISDPVSRLQDADVHPDHFDSVIRTNLNGAYHVARETCRRAAANTLPDCSIVNISSILGLTASARLPAYCASKGGLVHLTKALALDWARHNVRVNSIAPGYFITDMNREFFETNQAARDAIVSRIPQRRFGDLSDLDGALVLLASPASRHMTGVTLPVDGGHLVAGV